MLPNDTAKAMQDLEQLPHAQRSRLAFIDFCLQYFGQIARADLIRHFGIGLASGTRDFSLYRELAPDNLKLLHNTKLYYRTSAFKPVFPHHADAILTNLCRGFGDGIASITKPSGACFDAVRLIQPESEIIAGLMRAIQHQQAIHCDYVSLSSGMSQRELVPHSIVNNGHRWHVRAYDRQSSSFRDFVCTRFSHVESLQQAVKSNEFRDADNEWNIVVKLHLVPHPKLEQPQAIAMDYKMENGELLLEVRAALVGYLLQHWQVDCSPEATLDARQYPLRLEAPQLIEPYENAILAPGFQR